jgi:hypothetical protein
MVTTIDFRVARPGVWLKRRTRQPQRAACFFSATKQAEKRNTFGRTPARLSHAQFCSITKAGLQSASCFYPGMVERN